MRRAVVRLALTFVAVGFLGCPPSDPSPGVFIVAAYGDSLTSDWEGVQSGYPWLLPAAWQKLNRGAYNEPGVIGAPRAQADAASLYTSDHVDAVVLMWGTNDLAWGAFIEDDDDYNEAVRDPLVNALVDAVVALRVQYIDVVVCVPPPTANDNEALVRRRDDLRVIFQETFPAYGAPVVDFSTNWPANLWSDGLHLNAAGKTYVANAVAGALQPFSQ
jgi:lysophospholipase L1-like esterase